MIYFVTKQQELFEREDITLVSMERSREIIYSFTQHIVQFDTETSGTNPHIDVDLLAQFGNIEETIQVVVDTTTVPLENYADILSTFFVIGQNLKFDEQVCYNHKIVIRWLWDTMVMEQLLFMGYPHFMIGATEDIINEYCATVDACDGWEDMDKDEHKLYLRVHAPTVADFIENHSGVSLKALVYRYRHEEMSKEVRGKINFLGSTNTAVIQYGAGDVTPLYSIYKAQYAKLVKRNMLKAALTENAFVPVTAYYEYCGVHLNEDLWKHKMELDNAKMQDALTKLNTYVVKMYKESGEAADTNTYRRGTVATSKRGKTKKKASVKIKPTGKWGDFIGVDMQYDLFNATQEPKCILNWNSQKQVIPFLTMLGFNCRGINKKTKEEKDSLEASVLAPQRHINPDFYDVYLAYTEAHKVCTTYGQNYINAQNPRTNRIHTQFRQLGTDTGRLACGSQQQNTSLARIKGLPCSSKNAPKDTNLKCAYPQLQNLPADALTRSCFCAEEGNAWVSIDYCGQESVLMADFSNDKAMLDVFLKGEDMHSTVAYMIFPDRIPRDTPIKAIKKQFHDLRQIAKGPEFCFAYGGNDSTLVSQYGMTPENAKAIYDNYMSGFPGIANFQNKQKRFVVQNGYILISPITGHRATWWDHSYWLKKHNEYNSGNFWDTYKMYHKGTNDAVAKEVSKHFKAKTKWEKNACNSPLQGCGAIIFKRFNKKLFDWVVDNGYFGIVKFCVPVHDEINVECPIEMKDEVTKVIQQIMKDAARPYLKTLELDSDATVSDHWIH